MNPSQPIRWPQAKNAQTQIAQIKGAGITNAGSTTTQGVPKPVSNVQVKKSIVNATTAKLTISFTQAPNDPYFVSAECYLRLGNSNPVSLGKGSASPLSFNVTRTSTPATIFVVSSGNWGSTPLATAPVKSVNLA